MDTENAVIYDSCQREIVKDISTVSPYVEGSIFSEAFIIETINLSNLPAFVVSSYKGN